MAEEPRVTRFKIEWDENGEMTTDENQPPVQSVIDSSSNMMIDNTNNSLAGKPVDNLLNTETNSNSLVLGATDMNIQKMEN